MNTIVKFSLVGLLLLLIIMAANPSQATGWNGRVTDEQPVVHYRIQAEAGAKLTVTMTRLSGDLLPYLVLLTDDGGTILTNSDVASTSGQAVLEYTFKSEGYYDLVATRIDAEEGSTTGDFVLSVTGANLGMNSVTARTVPSSNQPAVIVFSPVQLKGVITDNLPVVYYLVYLETNQQLSARMECLDGNLRPFLALLDSQDDNLTLTWGEADTETATVLQYKAEKSDWYRLVATRFDVELGTTTGQYELSIE